MILKISHILKNQGLFAQDIRNRFKTSQISLNGEIINEDLEINVALIKNEKGEDIEDVQDAGDFIFNIILNNNVFKERFFIFGFETLFESNIENNLTLKLKEFTVLRVSKKQSFVIKNCNE